MKIGIGYDIHRLVEGRTMVLGGEIIPFDKGPAGHSDGDVLLHAVCDAILGALGKGDIGMIFPDNDPKYKDISSKLLLGSVVELMEKSNARVNNLDCTVITEEPKIKPYHEAIAKTIGEILKVPAEAVNIKGKTNEGLGAIGRGEAIAAYVVVTVVE